jgi:poly(3-hydroxybutyrate) depolymerase
MAERRLFAVLLGLIAAPAITSGATYDDTEQARQSLFVDGAEREWRIFVPASYRDQEPAPLVLEFHGTGGTPESQMELSGFRALAEQQGFHPGGPRRAVPRARTGG